MHPAFFPQRERTSLNPLVAPAVGLILSDLSNPFFAEIIPAVEECLGAAGFTTLLGNAYEDSTKEARLLKTMRQCAPAEEFRCQSLHSSQILTQFDATVENC